MSERFDPEDCMTDELDQEFETVTETGVTFRVGTSGPRKPALRSCSRFFRREPDGAAPAGLLESERDRESGASGMSSKSILLFSGRGAPSGGAGSEAIAANV